MTSLRKMLSILDMFKTGRLAISMDMITQEMNLPKASAYRYVKELCHSGLLTKTDSHYSLGSKIPEFDWLTRKNDPLIYSSEKITTDLAKLTGLSVFICVFYNDQNFRINLGLISNELHNCPLERGITLPLFKGAQSKAIIAFLKGKKLKRFYEESVEKSPDYNLSWDEFSQITKSIRKDGYCLTNDELGIGYKGVAAPIIVAESDCILGSICLAGPSSSFDMLRFEGIIEKAINAAKSISESVLVEINNKALPDE